MVKSLILPVCVFWLLMPVAIGQDMSVEELLNNLKTDSYSGKSVDLDLEDVGIETLFSRLEKFSGLSLELSPDIPVQFSAKKTYRFKQVPWDRILSLILREFHLEAIPMDGAVYIQSIEDNLMRIIREDQLQTRGAFRIPSLFYFLAVLVLLGGTTGFLLHRKRQKSEQTSSGGFVIDPDKADEIMKRVTYLFEVEKIYRKEEISLQTLSEKLSIPSYQLSWIINKKMNITFSGLVNSYRVEEVKKRLASSQDDGKTILDIAFDAGFNTKTSFNRVFKNLTRMTPSQYRQRYKVPH
jgi:AraC-like DNA-binding protein